MASSGSSGRILRIEDSDSTAQVDRRRDVTVSKPCVVPGCTGTMDFHERLGTCSAPHTPEWPWYASWRCREDSSHAQLISHTEEAEIILRRWHRKH